MGKKKAVRRTATARGNRYASIYPGIPTHTAMADELALPSGLVTAVENLESLLGMPVWFLIQDKSERIEEFGKETFNTLGDLVASAFFHVRHSDLPSKEPIALVIDSNGGQARSAYELAMLLRRHCGGFVAVVPRHAKSAATLLTLGADRIVMNDHAELGPLDVQIWDPEREDLISGLDEYQSLERLQAFALKTMDSLMLMYIRRSGKKIKTSTPYVTEFITKLMEPLFAKIDVVRYTQMSRALKVAEEYGIRLLQRSYGSEGADIARRLVEDYPEHGFPIYPDELRELGLNVDVPGGTARNILEEMGRWLTGLNVVGKIVEDTA